MILTDSKGQIEIFIKGFALLRYVKPLQMAGYTEPVPGPGCINQTEKPRRWGRVAESEMGRARVMLLYVGH